MYGDKRVNYLMAGSISVRHWFYITSIVKVQFSIYRLECCFDSI
jgi:hypothetical protein